MIDYNDQPLQRLEPGYLEQYGLQDPPFSALVDERFYFSPPEAGQRLSLMVHMTQYSDMVLMVLAEEGMGKSTLLQNYIKSAHDNWHICRINANAMMDKAQLLFRIAEDFGLETLPADSAELQEMLYDKLTRLHANDVLPVLIIDDAHELAVDAISQLFIMAEIKAGDVPMVHVVLFAEPQIEKTLNASNVRKIRQRIGHTFELAPFDEAETAEYILSRMTTAGLQGENPFSAKVVRQIHKQSHGNPARINELAHIALDEAEGGNEPEFAEEAFPEQNYDLHSNSLFTPLRVFTVLAIATVAGLGLWQQDRINRLFTGQTAGGPDSAPPSLSRETEDRQAESPFAGLKEKLIDLTKMGQPATPNPSEPAPAPQSGTPAGLERIEDPAIAAQLQSSPTTPPAAPLIERLEPASLRTAPGKQTLLIHGKHFSPDTEVVLNRAGKPVPLSPSQWRLEGEHTLRLELATGQQAADWQITLNDPASGKSNRIGFRVESAGTPSNSKPRNAAQWVDRQPANNLTLQLLGSHSLHPINQYIAQHRLAEQTVIYQTTHDNKPWYVLFYGSFSNQQQAQQAIDQLPAAAKKNKPWIRRFASIRAQQKQAPQASRHSKTGGGKPPALDNLEAHEAWLWSQDPSKYTLQLLGTQNVDNIRQFIKQYHLRGKVVYYHTQHDKQDWYGLLYGVYPNNNDARLAANQLPPPIKKLSPWVRNFAAIHAEMDKTRQ